METLFGLSARAGCGLMRRRSTASRGSTDSSIFDRRGSNSGSKNILSATRASVFDRPARGWEAPMKFPMFVVAVPDLLALERLLPHQTMLEQGLLHEYTDEMAGHVLFLSHQWLGWKLNDA